MIQLHKFQTTIYDNVELGSGKMVGAQKNRCRSSNTGFVNFDKQSKNINDKLTSLMFTIDKKYGWNAKLSGYHEDWQMVSYNKNQHYQWHRDTAYKRGYPVADRYMSITLLVNEEGVDFEGGEFELDLSVPTYDLTKSRDELQKIVENNLSCSEMSVEDMNRIKSVKAPVSKPGDIVVFKAPCRHRVKKVTKGVRKSMVIWYLSDWGKEWRKKKIKRLKPKIYKGT